MPDLASAVCLVTGATRGAGLAIARNLGARGATVYVTGRSTRGAGRTEDLPGTIEDAAEAVTAAGGRGLPVCVDHRDDAQVEALFARIRDAEGRLDVLVNNAWAGYEQYDAMRFDAPLWEQPASRWAGMFEGGVRTHFVANTVAAPMMIARGRGLIVATIAWAFGAYLGNAYYDSAKAAIARLMFGLGTELRPHGVTAVALAPGFMRTERVLAAHAAHPFDLSVTESPDYLGRAVAALAADAGVIAKTGQLLTVGELAREYGFVDVDGRQPEAFRLP